MRPWVKVLLAGCIVTIAVAMTLVVIAYRFLTSNKDRFQAQAAEVRAEANAFGRTSTEGRCVDAALIRLRDDQSLLRQVRTRLWLTGCLETAAPDPDFCAKVPPKNEIIRTVTWRLAECSRRGFGDNDECPKMLTAMQEHCEKRGSLTR